MNVSIGVYGRFHAFNLAAGLDQSGALAKLITSYPRSYAQRFGVSRDKVSALPLFELLNRTNSYLKVKSKKKIDVGTSIRSAFANRLAKEIPRNSDIVTVWSGIAKPAFRKADEIGAIKILERGSTHPAFTRRILEEEYALQGVCDYRSPELDNDQSEYEEADYIAIPSSFVRQTFVDQGVSPDKLIVTPYGVDLDEFPFEPVPHKPFRFIYVGAMSFRKGVHYLLQAFDELKLKGAELWLVGALHDEMKPMFAKYEGSFKYYGTQKQSDLHKFYNQCDAFCICSIEEGMAMVQLQAISCGLPIICTTNTGGEDLIKSSIFGDVVPIRDISILKSCMEDQYYRRNEIYETKVVIRRIAVQDASWSSYCNKILDKYTNLKV